MRISFIWLGLDRLKWPTPRYHKISIAGSGSFSVFQPMLEPNAAEARGFSRSTSTAPYAHEKEKCITSTAHTRVATSVYAHKDDARMT